MAGLIDQLAPEYARGGIPAFAPGAKYYHGMDYLLYKCESGSYRADRVDAFLTVLWHPTEDWLVGVKLKGWRFFFNQMKDAMGFEDADFFPLIKAIEFALAEEFARQIMDDHDAVPPTERYRRAERYSRAILLVGDANVRTSEWAEAA